MVFEKNFIRKSWYDSRIGHSTYLMFLLVFLNFILITFNYLLEGSAFFGDLSSLWMFGIIFTIIYFPAAVLIGRWHTQTQLSTEKVLWGFEEPMVAKMVRILLDVQTGKASKEQIQEFDKFFTDIEKKDIGEF